MTNRKIELPLRTIDLNYDEKRPFHPFEEEMIDRYTQLHHFVTELFSEYETVQARYEHHNEQIKRALVYYNRLSEHMSQLENKVRIIMGTIAVDKKTVEMIAADAREFFQVMHSFNTEMQKLAATSEKMYSAFTPLNSNDERFTELFDEYKTMRDRFQNENEKWSLDSKQFNSDELEFFHSLTNMSKKQEEFVGVCNTVIDNYNHLIQHTENLYQRWEDYNKSVEIVKLMYVLPNDMTRVCMN